ncbi:restriction endonuclease subunit R, partial [Acidithiobacillus thiooxidans]
MIEFKQIIGRGTRLYEGKDFFTVYDFVKAHHHFGDPEWDGEPLEPEPTGGSGEVREPRLPLPPTERPVKIRVKLRDGKERSIQSISSTIYFGPDGNPVTAAQFLEGLFGTLPEFFKDEDALRQIWSDPETRKGFLQGLAEKGYNRELLMEMQQIIDAQNSDLYDV